jgi:hypothetical protein
MVDFRFRCRELWQSARTRLIARDDNRPGGRSRIRTSIGRKRSGLEIGRTGRKLHPSVTRHPCPARVRPYLDHWHHLLARVFNPRACSASTSAVCLAVSSASVRRSSGGVTGTSRNVFARNMLETPGTASGRNKIFVSTFIASPADVAEIEMMCPYLYCGISSAGGPRSPNHT